MCYESLRTRREKNETENILNKNDLKFHIFSEQNRQIKATQQNLNRRAANKYQDIVMIKFLKN